jgi:3-(3-hydroxy-phenyl)propionate hydroxylase
VAGYGPVGAVLAARLGALGVRTLVVERSAEPYPLPRAVAADDEVQQLLDLVAPGVVADMLRDQRVRFLDARRDPIGTIAFPPGPAGYSGLAFFSQPSLERSLRAAASAYDGVEVRLGVGLASFRQDDDGVTATLADGTAVRAGWLVGCDGASSGVRAAAGIGWRGRDLAHEWLVVDVTGSVPGRALFTYTCDPALPQVDMPLPGGHRWEWLLRGPVPQTGALLARDVDPAAVRVVRTARYRFGARHAARWVQGRVVLAGDAAHTMPPFAGQGLGAGVRDAWALATRLAQGGPGDYEALRAPHVARMTRLSLLVGAVLQARRGAGARDALLRKAFSAPALGPWLSRGGPRDSRSGVL